MLLPNASLIGTDWKTVALQPCCASTARFSSAALTSKARVNQAAINYHFKGKDGLYLEVLKTAFEKLTEHAEFDPERLKSLSREEAIRLRVTIIGQFVGMAAEEAGASTALPN